MNGRRIDRAHAVLWLLLVVKVGISGWNAHAYHGKQYDREHHLARVAKGGLAMTKHAYNPALYYLPALAYKEVRADLHKKSKKKLKVSPERLLETMRYTNVAYQAAFYALAIFVLFPALLPNAATSFVASLFLLAVPGFQKLAMMVHPDNLVPLFTVLALVVWIRGRRRARDAQGSARALSWPATIGLAVSIGAIGLTRPFAAAAVAVMWAAAVADELPSFDPKALLNRRFLARATVITLLVGTISLSWYGYRYAKTGVAGGSYKKDYIAQFEKHRADFDFVHFFTTFYPVELIERPNRTITSLDKENERAKNKYANSFFTLLHSELWGDHWLYVSGPKHEEQKLWPKRALIGLALPVMLLLPLGWWRSGVAAVRAGPARVIAAREPLVVALMFALGAALYLYWATGSGLLPGKSSTIKFIYVAYLVPLALVLALLVPPRPVMLRALGVYAGALYLASLPVVFFVP